MKFDDTSILCSSFFVIVASGGLIVLRRTTRSPEATAETTHTLRKWTIEANLNLNIQGLIEVKSLHVQGLESNLGSLISLSGTDPNT